MVDKYEDVSKTINVDGEMVEAASVSVVVEVSSTEDVRETVTVEGVCDRSAVVIVRVVGND